MAKTDNPKILERVAKDKAALLEALSNNCGIVSASCKAAGISRATFYEWYNDDEEFAEKVDDIKELQKDLCEALILKKMKEGDTTMIIFYAKTQMKDRGYSERREITGANGEDLIKPQEVDLTKLTPDQRALLLKIGEDALNEEKD